MKHIQSEYEICCTTKEGRARMVDRIEKLAAECGATVRMHEFNGAREIGLELVFGPYQCMMHFDGEEARRLGTFMGHWHVDCDSDARYPNTFWRVGSLNTYHFSKATTIEDRLPVFLQKLRDGLTILSQLETAPRQVEDIFA